MAQDFFDFSGKTALVTGASRGIGYAIAAALAARGAHVVISSRKPEALMEAARSIRDAGGQATPITCNTGDMANIDDLFENISERVGQLDYLVNNAATNPFYGKLLDLDPGAWEKTLAVNLRGVFFISQRAARMMEQQGGGAIVNVASVNGISPPVMQGVYSITKAGVISMTKAYAKELAPLNIRVNALCPGLTDTKFAAVLVKNLKTTYKAMHRIPLERPAQPEEMVGAVLYFLSDAASYTTGSCLIVDGGMLA